MDAVEAWTRWRPALAVAAQGDHQTIETIEADLVAGSAKLWASEDCCMVVEFHRFPGGAHSCRVLWAAGDIPALKRDIQLLIEDARALDCTEVLIEGRVGWERVVRDLDFKPWAVTLRKAL